MNDDERYRQTMERLDAEEREEQELKEREAQARQAHLAPYVSGVNKTFTLRRPPSDN